MCNWRPENPTIRHQQATASGTPEMWVGLSVKDLRPGALKVMRPGSPHANRAVYCPLRWSGWMLNSVNPLFPLICISWNANVLYQPQIPQKYFAYLDSSDDLSTAVRSSPLLSSAGPYGCLQSTLGLHIQIQTRSWNQVVQCSSTAQCRNLSPPFLQGQRHLWDLSHSFLE